MQPDARAHSPAERRGGGIRNDGIRTIEDLRDRCVVDDITGCWHWRGALSGGRYPSLWLPALGRRVTLATAICVLQTGKPPKPGQVWHVKCETRCCANPAHRKLGTRSTQMLAAAVERTPLQRVRIAAGKRAASHLSQEVIEAVRADKGNLAEIAARAGISVSYASLIRRGEARRSLNAVAVTSIFAMGAA